MSKRKDFSKDFSKRLNMILDEIGVIKGHGRNVRFSKLVKVTPGATRKWLNGEAVPSMTRAKDIADKLGANLSWLIDGNGEMMNTDVRKAA
jgi:hypothetical protein